MRRADAGIATIWTAVVAVACLSMAGLVMDGGRILRARSSSYDLAGGAARVATQELDEVALNRGDVVVDVDAATGSALAWLAERDAGGSVVVEGDTVTVTVVQQVDMKFLPLASVEVSETATAQARRGGT